ncbi:MAG: exo-beta-1,3-glucanase, partial [Methylobacter sp.]|nr:exo-beta-1,3-glucanase [Methylobacter sp.]
MKQRLLSLTVLIALFVCQNASARTKTIKPANKNALQCAAFSPYVGKLNPDYGAHPSKALIGQLLDKLVKDTPFRCIMTYGVINGLEHTFAAAEARHLKVIAIIWLDDDITVNSRSISAGIEAAKAYPNTIIKLSCGSE